MTAEPTEVAPGGSAIITAQVVKAGGDSTGGTDTTTTTTTVEPNAWGVNVTFKLLTANGGRLSALTQETDGSGVATVVYTAGNNYSQDVIQATLENGNSLSLIIKKTGNPPGISIEITDPSTSPATAKVYGYVSITAQVTDNSTGTAQPISGETVEFTLTENGSGGSVKVQSAVTDAAGKATALYQAGGNYSTTDVVQAKLLSNGSVSTVIITVTGSTPVGPAVSVEASSDTVNAGAQSIITITVTDGNNLAVMGTYVDVWIEPNKSGASIIVPNHYTDALGKVVATYLGGTHSISATVTDTVQAKAGSSTGAVVITRAGSSSGYSVTLAATSTSLESRQTSIITATVTESGNPAVGVNVAFTCSPNNSGATLNGSSSASATTDGTGKAQITYIAGSESPTLTVQDTVQASVGSATSALVMTRTGSSSGYAVTVTASPSSLSSADGQSTVTANVKNNNTGTAVVGRSVTFSVSGSGNGTVDGASSVSKPTDGNGNAVTTYQAHVSGSAITRYDTIVATVMIDSITYTGAVTIPITVP